MKPLLRRRAVIAGGIVLVVVAVLVVGWFAWLPSYRPALASGDRYGIDVSHYQGTIDWQRVAEDGVSFAYIKATEGSDFVDERFAANWAGSGEAGVQRGAYHYFSLCSTGAAQAQNFLGVVPYGDEALSPALDLELGGSCATRPEAQAVRHELSAFIQTVEAATGQQMLLYIGPTFERMYPVRSWFDRPAWRARFLVPPTAEWLVWQVGSYAHVDGIAGRVDLDIMRGAPVSPSG